MISFLKWYTGLALLANVLYLIILKMVAPELYKLTVELMSNSLKSISLKK